MVEGRVRVILPRNSAQFVYGRRDPHEWHCMWDTLGDDYMLGFQLWDAMDAPLPSVDVD